MNAKPGPRVALIDAAPVVINKVQGTLKRELQLSERS
jgi:hypothetical protein